MLLLLLFLLLLCVRGNFLHHTSFYTRNLLHQTPFTPNTLYINRLLHHTFHTQLSHLSYTFTPTSFYTRHLLPQPAFTRDTFYTNQLLHQTPFTIFHTKHPLHQTPLTKDNFLHHKSFYTTHLLHQTPFTFTDFYTTPFTPNTFYIKHLLHYPRQADQGGFEPLTPTHRSKIA